MRSPTSRRPTSWTAPAALLYYRRYPDEILRQVEANARLTPEVIEREFPGLVRFISVE